MSHAKNPPARLRRKVKQVRLDWCPGGEFSGNVLSSAYKLMLRTELIAKRIRLNDPTLSRSIIIVKATQRTQRTFIRCNVCRRRLHPKPVYNAFEIDLYTFVVPAHKAK